MVDSIEEAMNLVYEWLSDQEVNESERALAGLPEAIAEDRFLAISVCKMGGSVKGLLVVTSRRMVFINVPWMSKSVRESWKSSWDEVESVEHSDGKLTINKMRGFVKKQYFTVRSEDHIQRLLGIIREFAPILEKQGSVQEEGDESEEVVVSDTGVDKPKAPATDTVNGKSEKEFAIEKSIQKLSILDTRCLSKGEIKELPAILWEDELPSAMVSGRYHNGYGVLVATDRRLIFIDKGLVGLTIEDFYFEDISSVETHEGWLTGHIRIFARGNKEIIEDIRKDLVRSLADWIRNKLATKKNLMEPDMVTPSVQSSVSVADELAKFADLHKSGILTDEEFKEQKNRLLNSM